MVKLLIVLVEHSGWENALDEALVCRAKLEKACANEDKLIKPVVLFQAQRKDRDVTVEPLKN
jgi:type III restriction enzyme